MNTPVSFEIAKLLKEKGFDTKVRGRIHVSHFHLVINNAIPKNVNTYHTDMFAPIENWNDGKDHFMSIPTIAEVVMWIYEKHGIWIYVKQGYKWEWYIETVSNRPDLKYRDGLEDSPKEAYETGIEYTLKNLIK